MPPETNCDCSIRAIIGELVRCRLLKVVGHAFFMEAFPQLV